MSRSNQWCCRVIFRNNETGKSEHQELTVSAPGIDQAKAWGRAQWMSDRDEDLDRGRIVFLAISAELVTEFQMELL